MKRYLHTFFIPGNHNPDLAWNKLLFFGCLVVLCSCSRVSPTRIPSTVPLLVEDVIVHRPLSERAQYVREGTIYHPSQITVGLVRPEERYTPVAQLTQNGAFRIDESQPFNVDFVLRSGEDAIFLITVLLDYQQIPFVLDGQRGLLHEIEIQAGKDLFIPVQVNVGGVGAHDLMFVVFRKPYQRPLEHDLRQDDWCLVNGKRTVVIVGDDDRAVQTLQPDVIGAPPPAGVDWGAFFLFANADGGHPADGPAQMKMVQQGRAGQAFPFRIWMSNLGNTNPRPVDYALVKFLNYHQVGFNGKHVLSVHLDEKQEVLFKDQVILPDRPGPNEVQVVYVAGPYRSLGEAKGDDVFVHGSGCLMIEGQK